MDSGLRTPDSRRVIYPGEEDIVRDFNGQRDSRLLIHELGTDRASERVLFVSQEPFVSSRWRAIAIDNQRALVFRVQGAAVIPTAAHLINMANGKSTPVFEPNRHLGNTPGAGLVGFRDGKAYFRTAQLGADFGILEADFKTSPHRNRTLVPSVPGKTLYQAHLIGDVIVAQYTHRDLRVEFVMFDLAGRRLVGFFPSEYGLPDLGHPSIPLIEGDATSESAYFSFSSVASTPRTFRVDVKERRFSILSNSGETDFDPAKVVLRRVEYRSHDGELIPMLLYSRAD